MESLFLFSRAVAKLLFSKITLFPTAKERRRTTANKNIKKAKA
jgi:hypothetical protein